MLQTFKRTRFAPSPTGFLHLGHVLSAIYVWGIAEQTGASVLLRIEDHDRGRYRKEYEDAILADLKWLGFLDRSEAVVFQRNRTQRYETALKQLQNSIYPCQCTRKEIKQRVPNQEGEELKYDQFCRVKHLDFDEKSAIRLMVSDESFSFEDKILGPIAQNPLRQCGDFILKEKDGSWSYQFCVAVDDLEQEIDLVVRGVDILESTARQLFLRQKLGGDSKITFAHHPLLSDRDGKKLSKRFFSESISEMRQNGKKPEELLGEAAHLGGLTTKPQAISIREISTLDFHLI